MCRGAKSSTSSEDERERSSPVRELKMKNRERDSSREEGKSGDGSEGKKN